MKLNIVIILNDSYELEANWLHTQLKVMDRLVKK